MFFSNNFYEFISYFNRFPGSSSVLLQKNTFQRCNLLQGLDIPKCVLHVHLGLHSCYGLAAASNKSATWQPHPPAGCGEEWKETGRNWWVRTRAVYQNSKGNSNDNDTDKEKTGYKPHKPGSHSPGPDQHWALPSRE